MPSSAVGNMTNNKIVRLGWWLVVYKVTMFDFLPFYNTGLHN